MIFSLETKTASHVESSAADSARKELPIPPCGYQRVKKNFQTITGFERKVANSFKARKTCIRIVA